MYKNVFSNTLINYRVTSLESIKCLGIDWDLVDVRF